MTEMQACPECGGTTEHAPSCRTGQFWKAKAENPTTHYTCPECGGVSSTPKNCGTEGCALNGQPLHECHCEDGMHAGAHEPGMH